MTAWIVAAAFVAFLVLLALVKCRAEAAYNEDGFRWRVSLGFITLAPREGKPKRGKKPRRAKSAESKTRKAPDIDQLRAWAALALRLLKRFFKRLRIELLRVHFISAYDDPYDTAMAYGYAGSAMETVTELANGRIGRLDLHTEPDFDAAQPRVDAHVIVFVRVGDLIILAISAWRGYRAVKRRAKKEKENEHGESVDR